MKEEIIIIACQRLLMRFYWRLSKESQQSTLAWTKVSQLTLQGPLPVMPYLGNFLHFGKILGLIGEIFYHLGILSMAYLTKIAIFYVFFSSYFLLWVNFGVNLEKNLGKFDHDLLATLAAAAWLFIFHSEFFWFLQKFVFFWKIINYCN